MRAMFFGMKKARSKAGFVHRDAVRRGAYCR